MNLLSKFKITKENILSDIGSMKGSMLVGNKWRGVVPDEKLIQDITEEGIALGWITPKLATEDSSFPQAVNDDAQLASLYLHKLNNAKERGIGFSLTLSDMERIVQRKTCYYSGQKLIRENNHKNRPTFDRKDNSKGYTKENTVVCCHWVNQMKNDLFESPCGYQTDVATLIKILGKIEN